LAISIDAENYVVKIRASLPDCKQKAARSKRKQFVSEYEDNVFRLQGYGDYFECNASCKTPKLTQLGMGEIRPNYSTKQQLDMQRPCQRSYLWELLLTNKDNHQRKTGKKFSKLCGKRR